MSREENVPKSGSGVSKSAAGASSPAPGKWMTVYLPAAGAASALAFSTNVMYPRIFRRCFSPNQLTVANLLWFNAHIGTGLYLYSRPHIISAGPRWRIGYSLFGAVLFNFGTVLFWATSKTLLPRSDFLRTVFGIVSGVAFFYVGSRYLQHIDDYVDRR